MTKSRLLPPVVRLVALAIALACLSVAPASAGPPGPICCLCECGSLVRCEQSVDVCGVCPGGPNSTCSLETVLGNCTAVPACAAGVGSAAAPTMGPNIMAVLAALLGAAGVIRVRKGRKRKPHK
jgi:hypothetical protein